MNSNFNRFLKKSIRKIQAHPVLHVLKPFTDSILRVNGLYEETEALRESPEPVILLGVNKLSIKFFKLLENTDLNVKLIALEGENVPPQLGGKCISFEDLIYLKAENPRFYSMSPNMDGFVKSRLLELGFRPQSVKRLGCGTYARIRGCKLADGYDPLLGSVRTDDSKYTGYTVFGNPDSESALRIIVLGGSTSDPTLMNIKSWSEYLYESLCSMGVEAVLFNGAVGGYCSSQEMKKLIRDINIIRPNIVFSLSGVNDAAGIYTEPQHPLYQREDSTAAQWLVKHRKAVNGLQDNIPLKKVSLGLDDGRSLFNIWLDNERTMHAVCSEFGAEFHAFLQPVKELNSVKTGFYPDAKKYFARSHPLWLHDISRIFDGDKSVFADFCHVYEKGNRLLSRYMLRFVLEYKDRQ